MRPSPMMAKAALAVGVLATAAGCTAEGNATSPDLEGANAQSSSWTATQIALTPDVDTIAVGESMQLAVSMTGLRGPVRYTPAYASLDTRVATVTRGGKVTGQAGGTALVVATFRTFSDTARVVVQAPVARVQVTPDSGTITVGQTATLQVGTRDAAGNAVTGVAPTWTSSDPAVATVSSAGVVTARGNGQADITATVSGQKGTAHIRTSAVSAASIDLSAAAATLVAGQAYQLTAVVKDGGGNALTGRVVTWTSADEKVVTVSGTGLVTAAAAGSAGITATVDGKSATATMNVNAPSVTSVAVSANATTLKIGETTQLSAVAKDASGATLSGQQASWKSSNDAVATVSPAGLVTAVAAGSATLTGTIGGKSGSVDVTVSSVAVASMAISGSTGPISAGQTTQLSAVAKDAAGRTISGRDVTWETSDAAIATVSTAGLVTGVASGTAIISASVDGVSARVQVGITAAPAPQPSPSPSVGVAELPRQYMQTAASATPSGGATIRVAAGGDLQAAIDGAQLGDQIVLARGAVFVGNYTLRNKSAGSGWITIRSEGSLPAEGTRMTPAAAASYALPKILTGNTVSAIHTESGAHNYRIMGVEVGSTPTLTFTYDLVAFGSGGETSVAALPHHLILDRVYVHGHGTLDLARCVTLNSAWSAVVDSYLGECHGRGHDSQAIIGWNGSGPFKIVNNTLQGAAENVMFGGSDSRSAELIPSDIEFRHNYVVKPASWQGVWMVKNLFELKVGKRVLVEGNVFEGSWPDGQSGTAIVIKSTNQEGTAPWSTTQDVTFRYNRIRRATSGFGIDGNPEAKTVWQPTVRVYVAHNVFEPMSLNFSGGSSRYFLVGNSVSDLTIEHNTGFSPQSGIMFSNGVQKNFVLRNNVSHAGQYGGAIASADGHGVGADALAYHAPGAVVGGNLFIAANGNSYPPGNMNAADVNAAGFTDFANMNFRLTSGSTYRAKGTDGTDPGANFDAIDRYTSGVVIP